jgi:hypothetical protein
MNTVSPLALSYSNSPTRNAARSLQGRDCYLAKQIDACAREQRGANVVSLFEPTTSKPGATLQAIISKEYCLFDCGLVCLPLLPATIGESTLEILLDSLVSWLRPRGELILCAFTVAPETPLPDPIGDWRPGVKTPERLLRLARHIDDASARVHCEHTDNLAYLHLQRH